MSVGVNLIVLLSTLLIVDKIPSFSEELLTDPFSRTNVLSSSPNVINSVDSISLVAGLITCTKNLEYPSSIEKSTYGYCVPASENKGLISSIVNTLFVLHKV